MEHKTDVCVTGQPARHVRLRFDRVARGRPVRHLALVLEYNSGQEHMVLQVLTNAWQVLDNVDTKIAKRRRLPDAREHQKFGTADGTRSKNHFSIGPDVPQRAL